MTAAATKAVNFSGIMAAVSSVGLPRPVLAELDIFGRLLSRNRLGGLANSFSMLAACWYCSLPTKLSLSNPGTGGN